MKRIVMGFLLIGFCTKLVQAEDFVERAKKTITKADIVPATTVFTTKDLMMLLAGRVRNEYFNLGRAQTFNKDQKMFDNQHLTRLKASWLVGVQQGRRAFGKPGIEAGMKITHYSYWKDQTRYVPLSEEVLSIRDLDNAIIGDHTHRNVMPIVFMEDAFFKIHIDPFIHCFKDFPTYIQAGTFPFVLGRGLSLGSYSDGGIPHMAWELDGNANSLEQSPIGLLIHSQLTKQISLDLYYTKFRERSASVSSTREPTRITRLFGIRPERGIDKDREAWAVRMEYKNKDNSWGSLEVEPYLMYARAPDQMIERASDASTKLWTYGVMADYKCGGFKVNMEFAGNLGHQDMHAIDRNQVILKRDKTDGKVREVFSHVFVSAAGAGLSPIPLVPEGGIPVMNYNADQTGQTPFLTCDGKPLLRSIEQGLPYFSNDEDVAAVTAINLPVMDSPSNSATAFTDPSTDILDVVNLDVNRAIPKNGKQLLRYDRSPGAVEGQLTGASVNLPISSSNAFSRLAAALGFPNQAQSVEAASTSRRVVNSNLDLAGRKRFRPAYRIDLRGIMMLCDIGYTFENLPIKLAATAQWIGGDVYPYNQECNKRYKGFMTLRDYNYVGYDVPLFALLYARVLPRPLNISYEKMYAFNHFEDASNLRILGAGFTWYPVKDNKAQSMVMVNIAGVWNDAALKKWDCNGCPDFDDLTNFAITGGPGFPGIRDELSFQGWESKEKASHYMGLEINLYWEYHPFPNCKIYSINGIFIPGQLYKDLEGQPNRNTRRFDARPGREGKVIFDSLGHDIAYGLHIGMRFAF